MPALPFALPSFMVRVDGTLASAAAPFRVSSVQLPSSMVGAFGALSPPPQPDSSATSATRRAATRARGLVRFTASCTFPGVEVAERDGTPGLDAGHRAGGHHHPHRVLAGHRACDGGAAPVAAALHPPTSR